jgi:hypothetical protein
VLDSVNNLEKRIFEMDIEKDMQIREQAKVIKQKDRIIEQKDNVIHEKDKFIHEKFVKMHDLQNIIDSYKTSRTQLLALCMKMNENINNKNNYEDLLTINNDISNFIINEENNIVLDLQFKKEQENKISELLNNVLKQGEIITQLEEDIKSRDKIISDKQTLLKQKDAIISEYKNSTSQQTFDEQNKQISLLTNQVNNLENRSKQYDNLYNEYMFCLKDFEKYLFIMMVRTSNLEHELSQKNFLLKDNETLYKLKHTIDIIDKFRHDKRLLLSDDIIDKYFEDTSLDEYLKD